MDFWQEKEPFLLQGETDTVFLITVTDENDFYTMLNILLLNKSVFINLAIGIYISWKDENENLICKNS